MASRTVMRLHLLCFGLLLSGSSACSDDEGFELVVDVRTDLVALVDFESVRVTLEERTEAFRPSTSDDFGRGVRVAELGGLAPGSKSLRVTLLDGAGAVVVTRDVAFELDRDLGLTVVMSRRCVGVVCGATAGAPSTCHGGNCVPPECSERDRRACGDPECEANAECTATCASAVCAGGLCLTAGCEEPADAGLPGDGGTEDGGASVDAGVDAGCMFSPFGPASNVSEVSSSGIDVGVEVSSDGLQLWLASERPGGFGFRDIYHSTRADRAARFSTPVQLPTVSSPRTDSDPSVSVDLLTIYGRRSRAPGTDLWMASRSATTDPFGAPTFLDALNSTGSDESPAISTDGLELFFASNRDGAFAIYVSRRADPAASFSSIAIVPEVSGPAGNENAPFLTADGLTLFFERQRSGDADIWSVTRPTVGAPFGLPQPVTELNTSSDEADVSTTADGRLIFFSSTRPGGLGDFDIWMAERTCL